jgi:hypothetical protein
MNHYKIGLPGLLLTKLQPQMAGGLKAGISLHLGRSALSHIAGLHERDGETVSLRALAL